PEAGAERRASRLAQPLRLHYFGGEAPGVTDICDQVPDLVRGRRHVNCRRTFHDLIQTQVVGPRKGATGARAAFCQRGVAAWRIALMIEVMPRPGFDHTAVGRPDAVPHWGHASRPWSASTRLATAICCSRDAAAGLPTPPCSTQVCGLNCSPPYAPLPVLACQLPPDSHCATASQLGVGAAPATPVDRV